MKMKHKLIACLLSVSGLPVFLTVVGCSVAGPTMPVAKVDGISGHFLSNQIVQLETGKAITFDELIEALQTRDLIFIGEVHSDPDHHLIEVQILQALMDRYGSRVVAMEAFQKTQQAVIDRYMTGASTEAEFLEDVKWKEQWGFDYHFYRPLMLLVRETGGGILGINAPNDIVRKVARHGLDSLGPTERNQLASNIDLDNERHRAYINEIYNIPAHGGLKNFEYFYEAQCVWEDTMAENMAEYLRENGGKMVVISGNGHIINKFGIPDRAVKRFSVSMATIMLYPLTDQANLERDTADFIWLTGDYSDRGLMSSQP
jgi:uncharacterized iron-regulated protein